MRVRALRKFGNFALAYSATFQPGLDYFGSEDGFLAYKQVGSTAFVLSNPLAPIGRCEDLIRRFVSERSDVCFWQTSRPVAEILEKIGFCVNEMGTETRLELGGYGFRRAKEAELPHGAQTRGELQLHDCGALSEFARSRGIASGLGSMAANARG